MDRYVIHGGRPLHGAIEISGAKNAAVAIIPAALMVDGVCRIENMPQISDVDMLLKILQGLGARVEYLSPSAVEIDCTQVRFTEPPYDLMRKIRASYYFIGSMLGRFGSAKTTMPGGCNFGVRPIDQHIKGMTAMGANVEVKNGFVYADTPDGRLHGAKVYLDKVSVGATMNIIIAATLARGRTVIENAAREPHIVDLANFLNSMGADIRGAGTDSIRIQGVERLHGGTYGVIPDQIEAGTYMTACAAAGGEVRLANVIPRHLECISAKLREMGVNLGFVTLHVGLGTFRPVNVENIEEHEMHKEYYCIPDETAKLIMDTKKAGHRVIAVGTTSIRTLESAATAKNEIAGKSGWTGIFIYPGYDFKIVDAIITNFHLPKSTLIMLISAFAGRNFVLNAYKTAVEMKYRFFSFGDAMFCSRKQPDAERAEELKELEELDRQREAEAAKKE